MTDEKIIEVEVTAEVFEHFEKRAEKENALPYQVQINEELRRIMERERAEESRDEEKIAA